MQASFLRLSVDPETKFFSPLESSCGDRYSSRCTYVSVCVYSLLCVPVVDPAEDPPRKSNGFLQALRIPI